MTYKSTVTSQKKKKSIIKVEVVYTKVWVNCHYDPLSTQIWNQSYSLRKETLSNMHPILLLGGQNILFYLLGIKVKIRYTFKDKKSNNFTIREGMVVFNAKREWMNLLT